MGMEEEFLKRLQQSPFFTGEEASEIIAFEFTNNISIPGRYQTRDGEWHKGIPLDVYIKEMEKNNEKVICISPYEGKNTGRDQEEH